jgi:hypothetical protein
MRKKKLKLNKDTLLVLESGDLRGVAGGAISPASNHCTATCPSVLNCVPPTHDCPTATSNCSVGCPTTPQPLP